MNELDQFVKHILQGKYYIRYCDDFLLVANYHEFGESASLAGGLLQIGQFLGEKLKLNLHPDKVIVRKMRQGIDFLGYISFSHYRLLRTKTKKRMLKKLEEKRTLLRQGDITLKTFRQTVMSYMGCCSHAETLKMQEKLKDIYREEYRNHGKQAEAYIDRGIYEKQRLKK